MNVEMFEMYAKYNLRMNQQVFSLAKTLSDADYQKDMGAFFGSINHTLNHIAVGDIFWLKRFAEHQSLFQSLEPIRQLSSPKGLNAIIFNDFEGLLTLRNLIDQCIASFVQELTILDLDSTISYKNTKGIESKKNFGLVLLHLFNHQTHHRGQVSALFSQMGLDVGVTDMIMDIVDV